jgi:hypothetical protein
MILKNKISLKNNLKFFKYVFKNNSKNLFYLKKSKKNNEPHIFQKIKK